MRPYFTLSKHLVDTFNITNMSLSITHDHGFAIAVAMIQKQLNQNVLYRTKPSRRQSILKRSPIKAGSMSILILFISCVYALVELFLCSISKRSINPNSTNAFICVVYSSTLQLLFGQMRLLDV